MGELNILRQLVHTILTEMNKDHYSQTIPWLDQQARHFTDEQDEYHNESDESDGR